MSYELFVGDNYNSKQNRIAGLHHYSEINGSLHLTLSEPANTTLLNGSIYTVFKDGVKVKHGEAKEKYSDLNGGDTVVLENASI